MSHELEIRADGRASMVYVGETPWHGLGVKVPHDLSPQQIMEAAGLDWSVNKVPAFAEIGGKQVPIGRSALVRDMDDRILDVVTDGWEPLQNSEAFEFFNRFVEEGDMDMDTAGSLYDGKIVWALAKTKQGFTLPGGDAIEGYLLFTNPHKFGKSIDVRFTNTRVVCNNTLTLANSEDAKVGARVTHRVEFDADQVARTMGLAQSNMNKYKEAAEFLSKSKASDEDVVEFFKRVFPVLSSKDNSKKLLSKNAQIALEVLETQPGADLFPGTMWNAFNAVTYMTNHVLGRSQNGRVQSLFYGANRDLNIKALNTALEMAD